jgi:hypothetical protein
MEAAGTGRGEGTMAMEARGEGKKVATTELWWNPSVPVAGSGGIRGAVGTRN